MAKVSQPSLYKHTHYFFNTNLIIRISGERYKRKINEETRLLRHKKHQRKGAIMFILRHTEGRNEAWKLYQKKSKAYLMAIVLGSPFLKIRTGICSQIFRVSWKYGENIFCTTCTGEQMASIVTHLTGARSIQKLRSLNIIQPQMPMARAKLIKTGDDELIKGMQELIGEI